MECNRLLPPKNLAKDVSRIVDRVLGEALSSRKFDLLSQRKWYGNHEMIHFKQIDSSWNDRIMLEIHEILFKGIWLNRIFLKRFLNWPLPHRSAKPARRSLDRPDGGPFGSTWGEGWPCCFWIWVILQMFRKKQLWLNLTDILLCRRVHVRRVIAFRRLGSQSEQDATYSVFLAQIAAAIMCVEKKHIYVKWHTWIHSSSLYMYIHIYRYILYGMFAWIYITLAAALHALNCEALSGPAAIGDIRGKSKYWMAHHGLLILTPLLPFQASIFSGWIPWHVVPGKEMRRLESKVVWVGWVSIESKSDSGWNMIFPERFPSVGYGYCSSYITIVPCVSMMEMVVFSPTGFLGLGLRIKETKPSPKPLGHTIRWWFQRYVIFIFTPICGDPIWLWCMFFFKWVGRKTTTS